VLELKNRLLIAAALLFGSTASSWAADAISQDVVVVDNAYNWSGVYIGAQAGYSWGSADVNYAGYPDGQYAWDLNPDGAIGGIYAGVNWQMASGLVVGAETEFNAHGNSDRAVYIDNYAPTAPGYYDMEAKLDWSGSTRLRLGYAMDRWMPYVTGGVAYGHYKTNLYDESEGEGNLLGWTAGAGVEYAVTNNLRVRLSYLYTDFGSDDFSTYYNTDGTEYDGPFKIDLDSHAVQVGISYNF
jgi:outer membrane immunogenic protein